MRERWSAALVRRTIRKAIRAAVPGARGYA
jgi:hypothetical protein